MCNIPSSWLENSASFARTGDKVTVSKKVSGPQYRVVLVIFDEVSDGSYCFDQFPMMRDPNSMGSSGVPNTLLYAQIDAVSATSNPRVACGLYGLIGSFLTECL
jgi:hypothetical protein